MLFQTFSFDNKVELKSTAPNGVVRAHGWLATPAACLLAVRTSRGPVSNLTVRQARSRAGSPVPVAGCQLGQEDPGRALAKLAASHRHSSATTASVLLLSCAVRFGLLGAPGAAARSSFPLTPPRACPCISRPSRLLAVSLLRAPA